MKKEKLYNAFGVVLDLIGLNQPVPLRFPERNSI